MKKQVDKSHYIFSKYLHKKRWISTWHQLNEVFNCNAKNVLEVGPGPGIVKKVLKSYGISHTTIDIDEELKPDIIGSATSLPFNDESFDCVCAFQMLEHIEYNDSLKAISEFVRVSNKSIILSLPNAKRLWGYKLYVPFIGALQFFIRKPSFSDKPHTFDGQHYWELNKKGYSVKRFVSDVSQLDIRLVKSFRVRENPYHHFFVFEKQEIV
jgi:2-polyprenyl-3-methyl-5-hydroxy-6-metoxy-1,4-benzoquinol methylase